MKTLIVGDSHCDDSFLANVHSVAREVDAKAIVQVGDFGFGFRGFDNVAATIRAWLDRDPDHVWYWVDGNHDNHDALARFVTDKGRSEPIAHLHERHFYVPRGCVFTLGSTICMGMGGAYSIDADMRKPHVTWWPGETITQSDWLEMEAQVAALREEGKEVEVMFTHDAPCSEAFETMLQSGGYKVDHDSEANRRALTAIVDHVRPQTLYHGHYHTRIRTVYTSPEGWDVQIEGIGANLIKRVSGHHRNPEVRLDDNVLVREF